MTFQRVFSRAGVSPFDEVKWDKRKASITDENGKRSLEFITSLWPQMYAYRVMGSAALGMAYTACGRLDLYFHFLLYPWELACGSLLVTEAGGVVTDLDGKPLKAWENSVIASNKSVHADFLRIVRERSL